MKKLIFSGLLCLFLLSSNAQYRTERTGYEGDFFSLEGALDLFKESSTLDNFERRLNSEKHWVNNLDLNYDGNIDYIRVEHRRQGNFHAIILQALVDRYEVQDVAVIEIEVIRRGEAILQIIGDEDLYGEEVVVEPLEGYSDSRRGYHSDYGDYVNVYYWRPVQYLLGRQYRIYASPYRWQYYPIWWAPRVQLTWNIFRPRIVIYSTRFRIAPRIRVIHVHNFYRPYRTYCPTVLQRTNTVRVRQGRTPIYRTTADRDNGRRATPRGRNVDTGRTRASSTSPSRQQSPTSISRKRSESSVSRSSQGKSNASSRQRNRSFETSPRTSPRSEASRSRSSTNQRSSANSGQKRSRSYNPKANSSSSPRRSSSTTRSASPKTRQSSPSRSGVSRSRNSSSSSTKARQAPQNNRKVGASSRSKVKRSQPSKSRSSSSSPSRSRKGNGE